ncbi:MAG: endonuclease/exonuclease/phosphatase family protein [Bacteriovoracaceae bacterium]|nr:endonuclease/exonuclease/phosphatase family protein [Bacteriovoracaceae bacterium]
MNKLSIFFIYMITAVTISLTAQTHAAELKIGSFNIKSFGTAKASNPFVMRRLAYILSRYDIAFLQELRNKDQQAIYALKSELEKYTGKNYSIIISQPLGRSTYKEQYAYIFDPAKVELLDFYTYDDGEEPYYDTFSREPFIAQFKHKASEEKFVTVGVHIAPSFVMSEIDELIHVYRDIKSRWKHENIVIMGDLNADCRYLDEYQEENLIIKEDPRFTWLIERGTDTTTAINTHCTYDRFIATASLASRVIHSKTGVYNLMRELNLYEDEAQAISDHFPIELTLDL